MFVNITWCDFYANRRRVKFFISNNLDSVDTTLSSGNFPAAKSVLNWILCELHII